MEFMDIHFYQCTIEQEYFRLGGGGGAELYV